MPVLVCTGCSSGLGALVLRQLVDLVASSSSERTPSTRWTILAGTRSTAPSILSARDAPRVDLQWLPLDLASLPSVRTFAQQVALELDNRGLTRIDALLLNAACWKSSFSGIEVRDGDRQRVWAEEAFVNHFSQHYLVHLLLPRLTAAPCPAPEPSPRSRIIYTTSSLQNSIQSLDDLRPILTDSSRPTSGKERYAASKLAQTVGFHAWKRHFVENETPVDIVAVSPGFVPTTNLSRESSFVARWLMRNVIYWFPFCSTEERGAQRILHCLPALPLPSHPAPSSPRSSSSSPSSSRISPTSTTTTPNPSSPQPTPSLTPSDPLAPLLAATRSSPRTILYVLDPEHPGDAGQRAPNPALGELLSHVELEDVERASTSASAKWDELSRVWWVSNEALEGWADGQGRTGGRAVAAVE
ncbi:hypothetical protein JCM1840_003375 [Sporobolomyces johnsonii]